MVFLWGGWDEFINFDGLEQARSNTTEVQWIELDSVKTEQDCRGPVVFDGNATCGFQNSSRPCMNSTQSTIGVETDEVKERCHMKYK